MATNTVFGHVANVAVGATFFKYKDMNAATVRRPTMGGAGTLKAGADSLVISGGYKDDIDQENVIVYTGQGGQDKTTTAHVKDQTLQLGNAALVVSQLHGLPVRVIRGADTKNPFAPSSGYRYD